MVDDGVRFSHQDLKMIVDRWKMAARPWFLI